ncbi:hypothetical protein ANN_00130 [Periplaneta americana]|uniref:Paired domain-containing protein n=1 Tax=Periplaneta americana TaxID=6978 RepID=A0ABQ8TQ80_PERAM|nr:hypothetical protein ANN_00130 [Periplaneta americana]
MARNTLTMADRIKIITLMEQNMRQVDVANILHVNQSIVSRLWRKFQETQSIADRPREGRPRKTTPGQVRNVRLSARRNPIASATTLRHDLREATGVVLSEQERRGFTALPGDVCSISHGQSPAPPKNVLIVLMWKLPVQFVTSPSTDMQTSGRQHSLKCAMGTRCRPVGTVVQQGEIESISAGSYGLLPSALRFPRTLHGIVGLGSVVGIALAFFAIGCEFDPGPRSMAFKCAKMR